MKVISSIFFSLHRFDPDQAWLFLQSMQRNEGEEDDVLLVEEKKSIMPHQRSFQ